MANYPAPPPYRRDGRVVSIGECMVELARGGDGRFGLAYGGDTFNTAAYMARCGIDVAYATALGDDPYSDGIAAAATAEGVDTSLIARLAGRMPGLYLIETKAGERTFWYWRDRAAARDLFEGAGGAAVVAAMTKARLVYFSGITLSIYSQQGVDVLAEALRDARAAGATIAMDSNYRPRGWGGDRARARATYQRFWSLAHVCLPTFDDEQALWDDKAPADTLARLTGLGVAEIVVKQGGDGALIRSGETDRLVPCPAPVEVVDSTAAGDSFNAGYLARRLSGDTPEAAATFAHKLAGVVIKHRGAIVPREATAGVVGRVAG